MDVRAEVLIAMVLCGAVTIIPRILPFVLSGHLKLPVPVVTWLRLMAPAILSVLLVPLLFFDVAEDKSSIKEVQELLELFVACAVTAAVFKLSKRNLGIAFLSGVATFALITYLL